MGAGVMTAGLGEGLMGSSSLSTMTVTSRRSISTRADAAMFVLLRLA